MEQRRIASTWRDGLPSDQLERAQTEALLVQSDLTSRYAALTRLLGDPAAAREEWERITAEEAEATMREAARAAQAVPTEEAPPEKSESSRRTMAKLKADRGQNDNQAGRQKKGPKRGG